MGSSKSDKQMEHASSTFSSEGESNDSVDVGEVAIGSSELVGHDTEEQNRTTAQVSGGAGKKKKFSFEPNPRIISNAWFQLLSEGTRFPSQDSERANSRQVAGFDDRERRAWGGATSGVN